MRNGYKVYDSDTHIRPGADTLDKVPLCPCSRVSAGPGEPQSTPQEASTGLAYTPPYPRSFRLRSGDSVGGWGADVPRTLGEAEPRATTRGASGQFMGSKYPSCTATTGTLMDASVTWTRRVLMSSSWSILAGPSGHENP